MSDKKKNERNKKSSNNDENNKNQNLSNASVSSSPDDLDDEFYSAYEKVSSDEEPRSSLYLDPDSRNASDIDDMQAPNEPNKFRSSMSLHHLHTVKSAAQQHIAGEIATPITDSENELTPQRSPLPISPAFRVSVLKSPLPRDLSHTSTRSIPHSLADHTKFVRISDGNTVESSPSQQKPRFSDISQRRNSRRSIKYDESFLTNLDTGNAFVYMVLPPDGGYGWVITFVSFLIQIITDGIVYSIGIVLPVMAEDLKVDMAEAVLISALQISFYYLSGPLTSTIINKCGFRAVAMLGAFLGATFLLISSFSPNIEMLLVFYSFLGGPSLSMAWVSSQLIIGYYFEKYRSIANGLSCAGSGAGLIIFIQLHTHLVPRIGWRNNMRVQAGLLLVALLLAISYAEVPPSRIGIIRETSDILSDEDDEREVKTFNYAEPASVEPEDRAVEFITLDKIPTKELRAYKHPSANPIQRCLNKCVCCKCCQSKKPMEISDDGTKRYVIRKELIQRQDLYYTGPAEYTEYDRAAKREIIDGQDVELLEIDRPVHSINYSISQFAPKKSKTEEIKRESTGRNFCGRLNPANCLPQQVKKTLGILFNFSLFHIMEFQVCFFSAFLFALAYNIPFLFSKARLKLPSDQMSKIPVFIGITNFLFRIICGFIAFKFRRSVIYLCGSTAVLGGLACIVSAFYGLDNFGFQIAYASFFGIAPAFFSTLRAIIYVQYLGLENLTNAFCLIAMGMGIAIFTGTMIGGFLNKITGNFTASFVFAGICIVAAGVLKLLLPTLSSRRMSERKVKFQV